VPSEKLEHWAEELKAAGVRANAPGLSAFARSEEQAADGKGGEDEAEGKRLKEEGNALVKAGRHAEARAKYSASIAAWKHDPASYSNRALCAFKAGEVSLSPTRHFAPPRHFPLLPLWCAGASSTPPLIAWSGTRRWTKPSATA
jgi:hypothetical protein